MSDVHSRAPRFASIGLVEIGEELAHARRTGAVAAQGLIGRFFHSDVARGWQGEILAEPAAGSFLVQCFSWVAGYATGGERLVAFSDMSDWRFYGSAEEMNWAYEHGGVHERWQREREVGDD